MEGASSKDLGLGYDLFLHSKQDVKRVDDFADLDLEPVLLKETLTEGIPTRCMTPETVDPRIWQDLQRSVWKPVEEDPISKPIGSGEGSVWGDLLCNAVMAGTYFERIEKLEARMDKVEAKMSALEDFVIQRIVEFGDILREKEEIKPANLNTPP